MAGVLPAFTDTDITAGFEAPMTSPEGVVRQSHPADTRRGPEALAPGFMRACFPPVSRWVMPLITR
jgi:hypothetical protein